MNWKHVATVYLKELKDSLRDRRALLSMIIIPTLVMPLLVFGMGKIATISIAPEAAGSASVRAVAEAISSEYPS